MRCRLPPTARGRPEGHALGATILSRRSSDADPAPPATGVSPAASLHPVGRSHAFKSAAPARPRIPWCSFSPATREKRLSMHPSIDSPTAVALSASAFLSLALAHPSGPVTAPRAGPSDPVQEAPATVGTRLLDLDGDGALDLLGLHADGSLSVQRNVGPRRFALVAQQLPRVEVQDVLCTDLDGDTLP